MTKTGKAGHEELRREYRRSDFGDLFRGKYARPTAEEASVTVLEEVDTLHGMTRVQALEREVEALSRDELVAFRQWFEVYDAEAWDGQFEQDVQAGKLDALAEEALEEYEAGECTDL